MTHRTRTTMEALSAIHQAKRPPETNPNLVYSIMGEIRTQKAGQAWDMAHIAFPFSAVAGLAAVALFMISTNSTIGFEDLMVSMLNGGTLVTGM